MLIRVLIMNVRIVMMLISLIVYGSVVDIMFDIDCG